MLLSGPHGPGVMAMGGVGPLSSATAAPSWSMEHQPFFHHAPPTRRQVATCNSLPQPPSYAKGSDLQVPRD